MKPSEIVYGGEEELARHVGIKNKNLSAKGINDQIRGIPRCLVGIRYGVGIRAGGAARGRVLDGRSTLTIEKVGLQKKGSTVVFASEMGTINGPLQEMEGEKGRLCD